jgi:hypothetical protein
VPYPDVGFMCPNGEIVTEEMHEGALLYRKYIHSFAQLGTVLHIEEKVNIANVHPQCFGTPDLWFVQEDTLHVLDYKFGFSFVEVFENWQLIEYACGIMQKLDTILQITFHIIQPRSYHKDGPIRTWSINLYEFNDYLNKLRESEYNAMGYKPPCFPSPQCANCSAAHVCQALQNAALQVADNTYTNVPFELSPQALSRELKTLQAAQTLLAARVDGLEQQAMSIIKKGERVPGFSLEQSQSRERWNAPADTVLTLGYMMGVELTKPIELVTPKQAIKLGIDHEVVRKYSETPPGTLKLVFTPDKRKIFK